MKTPRTACWNASIPASAKEQAQFENNYHPDNHRQQRNSLATHLLQDAQPGMVAPPAYLRIACTISERIASGFYGTQSKLPSESQFCREFGVSHMTLRRALNILIDKGLVSAHRGKGTFVRCFDLSDSIFAVRQLTDGWPSESTEIRLLSASLISANKRVAAKLAIPPGDRVVHVRQLALVHKVPALYHWEYMPDDPLEPYFERPLESTSLHGLLGIAEESKCARGHVALRATTLGATAARALDKPRRTPALCIEHLFEDRLRRPLSWGCLVFRADLVTLETYLGPTEPGLENEDRTDEFGRLKYEP